jgi:hypothetical protein
MPKNHGKPFLYAGMPIAGAIHKVLDFSPLIHDVEDMVSPLLMPDISYASFYAKKRLKTGAC